MPSEKIRRGHGLGGLHGPRVRVINPQITVVWVQLDARVDEPKRAPGSTAGVVLVRVFTVAVRLGEVEHAVLTGWIPQPVLDRDVDDVIRVHVVFWIFQVDASDGEHVHDNRDLVVGHPLGDPHRAVGLGIGHEVHDPPLGGIRDEQRLRSSLERSGRAVEAVFGREVAHGADGAAGGGAALHRDAGQFVDAE